MGRLSFVGLGLNSMGVTLEGAAEMKSADTVYLEYYTTPHEPRLIKELERATGRPLSVVDRGFVEDGNAILTEAEGKRVVLAVLGDPMIATTHNELRARAIRRGIETRIVHSATISSAAASASGLHSYKFSRTVTVTRESVRKLTQAYHILHSNLLEGAHTLILLEYDVQSGEGVAPGDAIAGLLLAEGNFKRGAVNEDTFAMVLSRLGREGCDTTAGSLRELSKKAYGEPPHSVIVPGKLHFSEVEAVAAIFRLADHEVRSNSDGVLRTAQTLVPRYAAKTRKALESLKPRLAAQYEPVVENAELYMKDAETFLANGEDEMAMLSIGYAEGLLDSLSFAGVAKIDW
ncbi:MAG: diphthine synthase [Nitrososphaerota archaeon]|jgi:diphthine synthase|nr:diphthine synthase [Nitrososphaerota archaeon]MDG6942189.1 diphthine synthase [Nitrososphaerota archaeon]MDG6942654.1 diphthine synthase [Nitrososphaerota archaeon]MDG6948441.1 diphthine synthase [Nitrososphaerota archaeon]MDG6950367.1 diphthine synthase [Nitrososphaerota archaeon]